MIKTKVLLLIICTIVLSFTSPARARLLDKEREKLSALIRKDNSGKLDDPKERAIIKLYDKYMFGKLKERDFRAQWHKLEGREPEKPSREALVFHAQTNRAMEAISLLAEARAALTNERWERAIDLATKAIDRSPQFLGPYDLRIKASTHILRSRRRNRRHERFLNEAVTAFPRNANFLFYRGSYYSDIRKYDLAIRDLNKSMELDGSRYAPLFHRASAYFHRWNSTRSRRDKSRVSEDYRRLRRMSGVPKRVLDNVRGMIDLMNKR